MALLSTKDDLKSPVRLTRDDWIEAALRTLVAEGVEAVQITRLARDLDVTRGSFYWHFKNRNEVLDALIREWQARNTGVMVEAVRNARSLPEGILQLFYVWVDHNQFDPMLDQSMRDWARRSKRLRKTVEAEDENRVGAIAAFFERFGFEIREAFIRARVIYYTQLSYFALSIDEPLEKRLSYLPAYYRCFTGQEIPSEYAEEFSERLKSRKVRDGNAA